LAAVRPNLSRSTWLGAIPKPAIRLYSSERRRGGQILGTKLALLLMIIDDRFRIDQPFVNVGHRLKEGYDWLTALICAGRA
jgi:hypothetical protein